MMIHVAKKKKKEREKSSLVCMFILVNRSHINNIIMEKKTKNSIKM